MVDAPVPAVYVVSAPVPVSERLQPIGSAELVPDIARLSKFSPTGVLNCATEIAVAGMDVTRDNKTISEGRSENMAWEGYAVDWPSRGSGPAFGCGTLHEVKWR